MSDYHDATELRNLRARIEQLEFRLDQLDEAISRELQRLRQAQRDLADSLAAAAPTLPPRPPHHLRRTNHDPRRLP